jgi:hypothetical protein
MVVPLKHMVRREQTLQDTKRRLRCGRSECPERIHLRFKN